MKKNKEHKIAVVFNKASDKYKDKKYYYITDKNVSKGDRIIVNTIFNDKTKATVVVEDSKKNTNMKLKRY